MVSLLVPPITTKVLILNCHYLFSLVVIKLLIGINLRAYALSRYANMQERAEEDQRNDRSRPHIGVGASEIVSSQKASLTIPMLETQLTLYCPAVPVPRQRS